MTAQVKIWTHMQKNRSFSFDGWMFNWQLSIFKNAWGRRRYYAWLNDTPLPEVVSTDNLQVFYAAELSLCTRFWNALISDGKWSPCNVVKSTRESDGNHLKGQCTHLMTPKERKHVNLGFEERWIYRPWSPEWKNYEAEHQILMEALSIFNYKSIIPRTPVYFHV